MTTHHELDRSISAWLVAEAPDRAPDDVLEASRERLRHTRQRRAWLPAWRYSPMNNYAKVAAAAAVVLVVGFVGYQMLPSRIGPGTPTAAPTVAPTPSLLARGSFKAKGVDVVLDAVGRGTNVTGRMDAAYDGVEFTVDLRCERTFEDGLLWIGGDVTESTDMEYALKGTRTAIVLERGDPVGALFIFQMTDPSSASCLAFFDDMRKLGPIEPPLEHIEGTVELAP